MTSSRNKKSVKYVSLRTWSCVNLPQLDMSSKLRLLKPLLHARYCHVLTTVSLCCQQLLLNSSSINFKMFKIVLPDSFSRLLNAPMLHHSWLNSFIFQELKEQNIKCVCAVFSSSLFERDWERWN